MLTDKPARLTTLAYAIMPALQGQYISLTCQNAPRHMSNDSTWQLYGSGTSFVTVTSTGNDIQHTEHSDHNSNRQWPNTSAQGQGFLLSTCPTDSLQCSQILFITLSKLSSLPLFFVKCTYSKTFDIWEPHTFRQQSEEFFPKVPATVTVYTGHRRTLFPSWDYLPVHHVRRNYLK